ncbi:MAG: hypothetical protein DHS20C18_20330 [Saprospiraceae bacterium]|nr:MAG: hypothetical protein DHS20C18_20330 [Saprospiraceae bacterium]
MTNAGDERLFVIEQAGIIKIIDGDGQVLPTPFLDIDSRVNSQSNERGLLGLAFHPNYAENGYFYVNYTQNSGDTRLSRFQVSADDPNQADPDSELIMLTADQPFSNHNGGHVAFGPDGFLYTGLGDGGSGGDPNNNGQNRLTFLGKMLRIDVDNGDPYTIPADNPFAEDDFTLDEIWALGLRNPWRFSFDRETGDLWIGDVGQGAWEEIDFQPANSTGGENYGWRCYEGNTAYNLSQCTGINDLTGPIHVYENGSNLGCSVTGGYVYRGSEFPKLTGFYLYTDYCSGRIWTLFQNENGVWHNEELLNANNNIFASFGEDQNGELYLVGRNGTIYKIVELCTGFELTSSVTDESCAGDADGSIDVTIAGGLAPISINWSNGAETEDLSGIEAGIYTVTAIDENGCEQKETLTVINSSPEAPMITISGTTLSVPDEYTAYQWYLEGELIEGATNATYDSSNPGIYTVVVTAANGCTTLSDEVNLVLGVMEQLGLQKFEINPNPTSDLLQIRLESQRSGTFSLRLHSLSGSVIMEEKIELNRSFQKSMDLRQLPAGTYILSLEQGGLEVTRLVEKQ